MTTVHMTIATTNPEQVKVPWLWRLGREFDLKVNILKANINEDAGWAFVALEGTRRGDSARHRVAAHHRAAY